ncbi:Pyrroline-5-carboxylate reductase [compost metagenome]
MGLSLFRAIGEAYPIPEEQMNILTGISGSGPAYAFYFMESMIAAGIKGGLSPELAKELTVQTVLGAASMVKLSGEEPAELRRKVTSPNGTTQAAIEEFQRRGLSDIIDAGIVRCVTRAAEIGEGLSQEVRQTS